MAFDPLHTHSSLVLSNSDLTLTASLSGVYGSRSVISATEKSYAEVLIVTGQVSPFIGIGVTSADYATQTGSWANSRVYYQQTGEKFLGDANQGAYGDSWGTNGTVIGIAYDPIAGKLWFAKNGVWQASGDPANGTNPAFTSVPSGLYLFITPYRGSAPADVVTGRFVAGDLSYSPPSGFTAWDEAGASTVIYQSIQIKRGTRAQVESAKTASGLKVGEPYLISDESRLAVGTAVNAYTDFAKTSEVDASKNGFLNRTDSTVSFVDGTRTFTISPAVTSFDFYANGTQYTKSTAQTVTITDTEGQWFIYFNDSGALTATQTFTELLITQYAFVAIIYWDAANNAAIFIGDERHGCLMDSQTHLYLHNTHGSAIDYPMGLAITNIVTDATGDLAIHAQVGVSGGGMWDEDIEHVIATLTAPASLPVFYLTGSGLWRRKTASAYPLLYAVTGTRANYNLLTGATWSVEEAASTDFVLSHLFATNDPSQPIIVIAGQNDYATLTQARENALTELQSLNTIGLPSQEFIAIATLIFQTRNTYSNVPKSRIRSTDAGDDYVDWRNTRIGGSGNAATVGWGNITGTLASQLDLQTALNGKAATVHTHVSADITDLATGGGYPSNLISSPLTVPADTSYIVMGELRIESDFTNNGNVGIL